MSTSPYENVFFYFRGPSAKDAGEPQVTRQVEDNTTKAFINVLQLADPSVVSSWIEALGVTGIAHDDFHADFYIQGGPVVCAAAQRHLAVITAGDDAASATWAESAADKGRIDAAIHVPGQLLIAIEAKVGAALDGGQLARHASDWGIPGLGELGPAGIPAGCLFTTWGAIYRWTRSLLERDDLPALSRFLLDQFADYLEIIGVTPFAGFRSEDFALLATRQQAVAGGVLPASTPVPGDPALAALIKDRVSKLWDAILPRLTRAEQATLGEIHVGSLRANDYRMWAATNWGVSGVNFTFELDPLQLELDLVAWKGGQVDLFDRWLKTPTAMRSLSAVGDLFELVVWRRRAIASKAGEPYWMHNTYEVIDRIPMPPPPDLIDRLAAHRDSCESGWERVAYHLRRSWPREAVLAAGEDLAEQAVHAIRAVIPLLHPINWPKPGPLPAERLVGIKPRVTLADMGFELAAGQRRRPVGVAVRRSWTVAHGQLAQRDASARNALPPRRLAGACKWSGDVRGVHDHQELCLRRAGRPHPSRFIRS